MVNALSVLLCNLAVLNAGDAEARTQLVSVAGELLDAAAGADLATLVAALGTVATRDEAVRALIVDLELAAKLEAVPRDAPARAASEELLRLVRKMDVSH